MINSQKDYNTGINSYEAFAKMKPNDREWLKTLIRRYLTPVKTRSSHRTSYGLKHVFERFMPSGYVSNGEMKGAMLACGYKAYRTGEINWEFSVSKKSPILAIGNDMLPAYGSSMAEIERFVDKHMRQ